MNNVQLVGNVCVDVEFHEGEKVNTAKFTVAVGRGFYNAQGHREADFIPVKVFGKTAENCSKYLSKGKKVSVNGSIQSSNYIDKDGIKRYATEVIGNEIEFLSPKGETSNVIERLEPIGNEGLPF